MSGYLRFRGSMRSHLTEDQSDRNSKTPTHPINIVHFKKVFLTLKSGAIKLCRKFYRMRHGKSVIRVLGRFMIWVVGVAGSLFIGYLALYLLPGPKVIAGFQKEVAFEKCQ